ncbi:EF-hand domain-containing protein D1-like [Choloepus didactylus]|uniref:EF-hand domain-containing protein D1-like n=1 Tax=Choloepus didactylus TaxID=27675 RepID=UPI00189F262F|nr:EF-hand domain-containing protein D1-like [Choloepus didactylus]
MWRLISGRHAACHPRPVPRGVSVPRSVATAREEAQCRLQREKAEEGGADSELSAQLDRRLDITQGAAPARRCRVFNPYSEFPEFSRRPIKDLERKFKLYHAGRDGYIDLMELKLMMEKLGAPQTHLGLKGVIKGVDEDLDGKLSFREFLLIFQKAAPGDLQEDSGLMALAKLSKVDVALEGFQGAKNFFEAKVQALSSASKFEAELKAEQDERKREEQERRQRRAAFRDLKAAFSTQPGDPDLRPQLGLTDAPAEPRTHRPVHSPDSLVGMLEAAPAPGGAAPGGS